LHQGAIEQVMPVSAIPLKGAHNIENVLAAVVSARLAGVPAEAIRTAVQSFQAVEHRLEFVATVNGVRRGLLQRLQSHQCRCDRQSHRSIP
jgi:UDP-N-acetylmuramoylalanine--D-glutamate ligase